MALKKTTIDKTTGEEVLAYWRIALNNVSRSDKTAHIEILAFKSEEISELAKSNKNIVAIDHKTFDVNPTDFDTYYAIPIVSQEGENETKQSYNYIKRSVLDENGLETNEFANSLDI